MNGNYLATFRQLGNTIPNREMSLQATVNDATNFGISESVHDLLKFRSSIGANDKNDFIDFVALFESIHRMSNHRPVPNKAQQLIKPHSLTAASRYNYGGNHEEVVSCQFSVVSGEAIGMHCIVKDFSC